jgi:hypothetical protein
MRALTSADVPEPPATTMRTYLAGQDCGSADAGGSVQATDTTAAIVPIDLRHAKVITLFVTKSLAIEHCRPRRTATVRPPHHNIAGQGRLLQPFSSTQSHDTLDIIQNVRTHILDFHAAAHVNSVDGVCQWHEYDATFVVNHRRR